MDCPEDLEAEPLILSVEIKLTNEATNRPYNKTSSGINRRAALFDLYLRPM